jgi:hypothetical protein
MKRRSGTRKGTQMLRKMISGLVVLGSLGCSLLAADDAFVGTWKLNAAKSKATKGREAKDLTLVITKEGDTATVTLTGTISGQPISQKWTEPTAGGPLNFTEGAPPAGVSIVSKRVDDRTFDATGTMNGKQIMTQRTVVSADQKTMTFKESGTDDKGPYKIMGVYDRQ